MAHGDLDGLASAAVVMAALRKRGESPVLEISQPYMLARNLLKLVAQKPRLVVIVDLGIDSATWPTISRAIEELTARGCRILWIDHHSGTAKRALDLANLSVTLLYTDCGSSSTIAKTAFAELTDNPAFYTKLARIGEVADGVAEGDAELSTLAGLLATALSAPSSKEEFKKKLVKMWVEERKLVSDDIALLAEEFDEALAEKLKSVEERVVLEVKRGLVIDARGMKLVGLAGHVATAIAQAKNKVAVLLFSPSEQTVVATCRVPRGINFDILSELTPAAAELGGGGGGHPRAAALRVPAAAGDSFLNRICEIMKQSLD